MLPPSSGRWSSTFRSSSRLRLKEPSSIWGRTGSVAGNGAGGGLSARGCEINEAEQKVLAERGLPVVLADARGYLEDFEDESIAAIAAIQVVEHLEPQYLLDVLQLIGRKLASGGAVIIETPNMLNWVVQENFWLDVSHIRPYPPETLKFYLDTAGVSEFELWYSFRRRPRRS